MLAVLLAGASPACFALDPSKAVSQYVHSAWRTEDGFPVDTVLSMVQTADGYLWLGTTEGLVRFNGADFKVFGQANTAEMKSSYIKCLLEDRNGNLWIGTWGGGLLRYRNGSFQSYSTTEGLPNDFVNSILEDATGRIWIGTRAGLAALQNGIFTRDWENGEPLKHGRIGALVQDRQDRIWVSSGGGLKIVEHGAVHDAQVPGLRQETKIETIYADARGGLWIVDDVTGLAYWNGHTLARYGPDQGLPKSTVTAIVLDRDQSLWVGTGASGLCRLNGERFECYSSHDGLTNDYVLSLFEDREGNLWVGGAADGLNRFKDGVVTPMGANIGLRGEVAWAVTEGRDNNIWVAMDTGLKNLKDGRVTAYTTKTGASNNYDISVWEDRHGNVWAGTQAGLNEFIGGRVDRVRTYTGKDGLVDGQITVIYETSSGVLWFGSRTGGVSRFEGGKFTSFTKNNGLGSNRVWTIFEDHVGAIWFGTDGKLSRFANGQFKSFDVPGAVAGREVLVSVQAIYEDRQHTMWLGTYGAGLKRFKAGQFATYYAKEGLDATYFGAILEDNKGNLWISSNTGILRIAKNELNDYADGKASSIHVSAYGTSDGMIIAQSASGTQPAGWKTHDGKLLFACSKGVMQVDPEKALSHSQPPPVHIEQVLINNKPAGLEDGVRTSVGQGELEFRFAAPSFYASEKVIYRYKLEGFDEDWIDAGARRVAYYTNIPPGPYRFHVLAATGDGTWNESGASFGFFLVPRFYQTAWFRGLCVLTGLGFVCCVYLWRVRQIRREAVHLASVVEERTRELQQEIHEHKRAKDELAKAKELAEAATRARGEFLANMSHEIRTPLNGVVGMLELAGQTDLTAEQKELLGIASDSADSLLSVINDILDFSKIEAGKLHFEFAEFDLTETVADAVRALAVRAHQKKLELAYSIEPAVSRYLTGDSTRLRQVLLNLLGNAIKFTERGEVVLRVSLESASVNQTTLRFSISDTGIGMSPDQQKSIFQAFSQADLSITRRFGGTGLGLTISSRIVSMMGGKIWVESVAGRGSTFHFTAVLETRKHFQERQGNELAGIHALVFDDNQTNRLVLQQMLVTAGVDVTAVSSARQAMDALTSTSLIDNPYQLLIADDCTPETDTLDLVRQAREIHGVPLHIIVMLTATEYSRVRERYKKIGVDTFLMKPVKASELLSAMRRELEDNDTPGPKSPIALPEVATAMNILVVDDNVVNQQLAFKMLTKMGHSVVLASNGREALEKLHTKDFDIIFMDMQMPEMDGLAATKAIRQQEKTSGGHVAIIAMTANAMKGDRELCLQAGMDGYVAKPISRKDLQRAIGQTRQEGSGVPAAEPLPVELSRNDSQ